jgi:acyl-coenzyme A synthetase/AMP-(fatty) acid ligase
MLKLAKNLKLCGDLNRFALFTARKLNTSSINLNNNEQFKDVLKTFTNSKISYATSTSEFHLVADRIHDLVVSQAEEKGSSLIYAFPHQRLNLTFVELKQRVDSMTQNLLDLGLQKGDRIALALPNTHELVIVFLSAARLGLITVLLNPAYQKLEFEYMLRKTNVKALFIYDSFKILNHMKLMQNICPELEQSRPGELNSKALPDLKHIIVLNSPFDPQKKTYSGTWNFDDFSKPKSHSLDQSKLPYVDIEDPCVILFTSGTTGNNLKKNDLKILRKIIIK